jgi:hypothetical protein
MNNQTLLSKPLDIKSVPTDLDSQFNNILKSCGIRSRSNSDNMNIPQSDSFNNTEVSNIDNVSKEVYCSESNNFPNIPFGKTPPDTHRIRELYMQYISHIQLKESK